MIHSSYSIVRYDKRPKAQTTQEQSGLRAQGPRGSVPNLCIARMQKLIIGARSEGRRGVIRVSGSGAICVPNKGPMVRSLSCTRLRKLNIYIPNPQRPCRLNPGATAFPTTEGMAAHEEVEGGNKTTGSRRVKSLLLRKWRRSGRSRPRPRQAGAMHFFTEYISSDK